MPENQQALFPFDAGPVRLVNDGGTPIGYGFTRRSEQYPCVLQDWVFLPSYDSAPRTTVRVEREQRRFSSRSDWLATAGRAWTAGSTYAWARGGLVRAEQVHYIGELVELKQLEILMGYAITDLPQEADFALDFDMIGSPCPPPPSPDHVKCLRENWYLGQAFDPAAGMSLEAPSKSAAADPENTIQQYAAANGPRRCIFHCFQYDHLAGAMNPGG